MQKVEDSYFVADPIIIGFTGGAIKAKARKDNAKQLDISWSLSVVSATNQRSQMRYRIVVKRDAGNSARVNAQPTQFANNNFTSPGTCKVKEPDPTFLKRMKLLSQKQKKS